jgi:hypothetical protein
VPAENQALPGSPGQETYATSAETQDLRAILCQLSEKYGRGIIREPQRVAAMLLDLCPERRRENFLLVSALRERVVSDLIASIDTVPEDILVTRGIRALCDHLGLAEDSARWAVESWLPASRVLASAPDRPLHFATDEPAISPSADMLHSRPRVDWAWLGWCVAAIVCATMALASVTFAALFHTWASFLAWAVHTGRLAAGLSGAGLGLGLVRRAIEARRAPNQRELDPNCAGGAMLVEVLTLLALPMVPVISVGLWAAEWIGELHISGRPHDLSFQFGNILQSLVIAFFLYHWWRTMTGVQGRIASSMVRSR